MLVEQPHACLEHKYARIAGLGGKVDRESVLLEALQSMAKRTRSDVLSEFSDFLEAGDFHSFVVGPPVGYGKTVFSVRSSLFYLLPTIAKTNAFSFSKQMLSVINKVYQVDIEKFRRYFGPMRIEVPPLVAALLQRSRSREDIPDQLRDLRTEFEGARKKLAVLEAQIHGQNRLRDILNAIEELERTRQHLLQQVLRAREKKTSIVRRIWYYGKEGGIWQALAKALDKALEWDATKPLTCRTQPFIDIYNQAMDIREDEYRRLLNRVFGENAIDYGALSRFQPVWKWIDDLHFNQ